MEHIYSRDIDTPVREVTQSEPVEQTKPHTRTERKPAKPKTSNRGKASNKRDEVLEVLKNKRRATAAFQRLSIEDNEALVPLLREVIEKQKADLAAAEAEHQKKLEAATEALMHLQSQGIDEREMASLLEEAKKNMPG